MAEWDQKLVVGNDTRVEFLTSLQEHQVRFPSEKSQHSDGSYMVYEPVRPIAKRARIDMIAAGLHAPESAPNCPQHITRLVIAPLAVRSAQ